MIVAIADDITGAAEIAGIGLRYGLRTVVSDHPSAHAETDLLVLYTNTRSMTEEKAVGTMEELTAKVQQLNPSLFYKKTDSVLRGHVLSELQAHMKILRRQNALLIPANPSLGRTIKDGIYYIDGRPIHETGFSSDPEFPVHSSRVEEMLSDHNRAVKILNPENQSSVQGIVVGAAETDRDIRRWSGQANDSLVLAGGASFFNALLQSRGLHQREKFAPPPLSLPLLFVSGTSFKKNTERLKQYPALVSWLPIDEHEDPEWPERVHNILLRHSKAIMAIGDKQRRDQPLLLTERISEAVRLLSRKIEIRELLIEGGATAYSIIGKLGWRSFQPTEELRQGIIRMQVEGHEDVHVTIKPGSYDWPDTWNFN